MFFPRFLFRFLIYLLLASALWTGCQRQPQVEQKESPSQSEEAPVSTNKGQIQKETTQYVAVLKPENPPLTTEEERLELEIKDKATGHPVAHEHLSATTVMQMPDHAMQAPTEIHELETPGVYEIETTFLMLGTWTIEVKKEPSKEELISFKVKVEEDLNE